MAEILKKSDENIREDCHRLFKAKNVSHLGLTFFDLFHPNGKMRNSKQCYLQIKKQYLYRFKLF